MYITFTSLVSGAGEGEGIGDWVERKEGEKMKRCETLTHAMATAKAKMSSV